MFIVKGGVIVRGNLFHQTRKNTEKPNLNELIKSEGSSDKIEVVLKSSYLQGSLYNNENIVKLQRF